MYLLTIYRLSEEGEVVPANVRLAERLGVSAVSVTEMVRKLHEKGLILKKSRALQLTREGERIALNVIRKHRLAERLLVDRLGIPWAHAYDQACKMEHILSDQVADALDDFLGHPTTCPHGQPIPDRLGTIQLQDAWPLASVLAGQQVLIERVKEGSVELVDYLVQVGLWPGQQVTVEQVAPFEGPLLVSVAGKSFPLSREVAGKVAVRPAHPTGGRVWLADDRPDGVRRNRPGTTRVRR
jgi:DtxR family Mn-dependent transcriptional regulator